MTNLEGFALCLAALSLLFGSACLALQFISRRQFLFLKQEVARLSDDLMQVVELQADLYRRVSRGLNDVEEKVLELSVPSADSPLPLERRHQVLTLARKGVSADEIARRLNMPKGETELIMNLRKYTDANPAEAAAAPAKAYARVGFTAM